MHPVEAATAAVSFLSRLTPKGANDEQELLRVINALTSFSNQSKSLYTNTSTNNSY